MIKQMSFLGLVVKDVDAATEFYSRKVGLTVDREQSIPSVYTQFTLNDGGAVFGVLGGFEHEGITQSFDAALVVDDVDSTYAQLQAEGIETLGEPRDMPFGRTFLFRTPDGHVLRIYSPPSVN
jgi:predicted enzyme related to lactoylglutathione lyase